MNGIVYIYNFFTVFIITKFVCKMEILTNKFLPSSINPALFQSCLRVNPMIETQILDGIIQTVFLVLHRLKTKGYMPYHRSPIEILYRQMNLIVNDNPHHC